MLGTALCKINEREENLMLNSRKGFDEKRENNEN